jgi:hypothetical protein
MRNVFAFSGTCLLYIFIFSGCKKEEDTSGYNCENATCTAVASGSEYKTLQECESACADNRPGSLQMNIKGHVNINVTFRCTLNIANSTADLDRQVYLDSRAYLELGSSNSGVDFNFVYENSFLPETYYYDLRYEMKGEVQKTRSGSFTILPVHNTTVEVTGF